MNTGAAIFLSLLMLFAALIALGFLISNTIDLNAELEQAESDRLLLEGTCVDLQQNLEHSNSELERLLFEVEALKDELETKEKLVAEYRQALKVTVEENILLRNAWNDGLHQLQQVQVNQVAKAPAVESQEGQGMTFPIKLPGGTSQPVENTRYQYYLGVILVGILAGGSITATGAGLYHHQRRLRKKQR